MLNYTKVITTTVLAHYHNADDAQVYNTGRYGLIDSITGQFTQQRKSFTHMNLPNVKKIFTESTIGPTLIKVIYDINYLSDYYNKCFIYFMNNEWPTSTRTKRESDGENMQVATLAAKLLEYLAKAGLANDSLMYFDTFYSLDRHQTTQLYHIGKYLGIDDPLFKELFSQKQKKEIEHRTDTLNQNALIKKIAMNKFKTDDLASLTEGQMAIIQLELNRPLNKADPLFSRMVASMDDLTDARLSRIIKEVYDKYSGQLSNDALLPSGDCPHVYLKAKITLENFNKPWLGNKLMDSLVEKYALPENSTGYFCKVCGGFLTGRDNATQLIFGEQVSEAPPDELQTMIWKEATFIVASNVRFKDMVPIKPFVSSLANGLRSIVGSEETRLFRSKTTQASTLKDSLNLYASIYIYASLAALMIANPGKLYFARDSPNKKPAIGGTKYVYVKGGAVHETSNLLKAEAEIVRNALLLLIISKEAIISRLKNINVVKGTFNEAYKWATNHVKPITLHEDSSDDANNDPCYIEPIFNYVLYARRREFFAKPTGPAPMKPEYIDYESIKTSGWHTDAYAFGSFLSTADFYIKHLYNYSVVPKHIQLVEYQEKYLAENRRQDEVVRIVLRRKFLLPTFGVRIRPAPVYKIDLAKHYCLNTGAEHKIGSYIYDLDGQTVELSKKDILDWLTNKTADYKKLRLADAKCGKCGLLIVSHAFDATMNKKLTDKFVQIDEINAFYQYYESRCVKGELHEYQDGKCTKCQFMPSFIASANEEYYNKYSADFNKVQLKQQALTIKSIAGLSDAKEILDTTGTPEYTYSLKNTAEISKLMSKPYNLLVNLGLTENIRYETITSGQANPSVEPYPYETRALKLRGYILWVIRQYNTLIRYETVSELSPELKSLKDLVKLDASLTFSDFIDTDNKYKYKISPENYTNFLLEYLNGMLLALDVKFAKYALDLILQKNKLLSRPTPFFYKADIISLEDATEDEGELSGHESDVSEEPDEPEEPDDEPAQNDLDAEGYDVEDANAIWDND
jgi:hypothetical protein